MSLYASLNSALSGLDVARRGIKLVSDNVSNANSEGYTRKRVDQVVDVIEGDVAGARTDDARRVVDEFLIGEARALATRAAKSDAIEGYQSRIQDTLFGQPGVDGRSIPGNVTELAVAFEELADVPSNPALQNQVVAAAEQLAERIGEGAESIQDLRRDADREIDQLVRDVNRDIEALRALNVNIARLGPTPDLRDRQDLLLRNVAENMDIQTLTRKDGSVSIYTERGQPLLEFSAFRLHYEPASSVEHNSAFNPMRIYAADDIDPATGQPDPAAPFETLVSGGVRAELTPEVDPAVDAALDPNVFRPIESVVGGGRLAGLLETRDRILPELADQYEELATAVRFTVDAQHNAGAGHPPPNAITGARTDLTSYGAAAPATGEAFMAVIDRTDGSTVSAIRIDLAAAATPAALAAQIDASLGALGTAAIGADGALELQLADADQGFAFNEGDSAIRVTDTAGRDRTFGFSHYFGLNDFFENDGAAAARFSVRADIADDGGRIATARLDVDDPAGGPLELTLGGSADNRAALGLARSLDAETDLIARGGLSARSVTVADYAADIVSTAAIDAEQASLAAEVDQALVEDIDFRASSISGVSLDEELSSLLLYQQAYSVSARIVSITDELLEELVNIAR